MWSRLNIDLESRKGRPGKERNAGVKQQEWKLGDVEEKWRQMDSGEQSRPIEDEGEMMPH